MSTSTSGFVGETERGTSQPTLVASWAIYRRVFGGCLDRPPFATPNINLPNAVRGFFENGGQRQYVARVVGAAAQTATDALPGADSDTTIRASGPGAWGNRLRIPVAPASAALGQPAGSTSPAAQWFRLRVLYDREPVPNPLVDPTDPEELANPARQAPDAFEDFDNLSHDSTRPNYAMTNVNAASI